MWLDWSAHCVIAINQRCKHLGAWLAIVQCQQCKLAVNRHQSQRNIGPRKSVAEGWNCQSDVLSAFMNCSKAITTVPYLFHHAKFCDIVEPSVLKWSNSSSQYSISWGKFIFFRASTDDVDSAYSNSVRVSIISSCWCICVPFLESHCINFAHFSRHYASVVSVCAQTPQLLDL